MPLAIGGSSFLEIRDDPGDGVQHFSFCLRLGNALQRGSGGPGMAAANRGVASQLKNPEPFFHAAHCLVKLGRREDAESALQGVLEIGAADPRYESVRQRAAALLKLLKGE